MYKARFAFVTDDAPRAPFTVTEHIGTQTVYVCPYCKTGGLRLAHELQYEGGCFDGEREEGGRHALNLDLVRGRLEVEPCINDSVLLEVLRIPLYCKQCRSECALVFRVEAKAHLYATLEAVN